MIIFLEMFLSSKNVEDIVQYLIKTIISILNFICLKNTYIFLTVQYTEHPFIFIKPH